VGIKNVYTELVAAKIKSGKFVKGILGMGLGVLVLVGSVFTVQKSQEAKSTRAATNICNGPITVKVSADGLDQKNSVSIPKGGPRKYYVHVTANGAGCSTAFEVNHCSEMIGSGTCANTATWGVAKPWGAFRSNDNGVARIDFDTYATSQDDRSFKARYRRLNSSDPWSNPVEVLTNGPAISRTSDVTGYWVSKPGYAWEYAGKNYLAKDVNGQPIASRSRIQIEEETNACGGIVTTPWRFTKSNMYGYWDPFIYSSLGWGGRNMRWFIVAPNYNYGPIPNFNNYFYAIGDKRYKLSDNTDSNFRDVNLNSLIGGYFNYTKGTRNPKVPGYVLLPKKLTQSLTYQDRFEGESFNLGSSNLNDTGCGLVMSNVNKYSSWKTREEKVQLTINNPGFSYSGEALRVDYFEGEIGLETAKNLLRESWYFVNNVGLVKVQVKHFNQYANFSGAAWCIDDNDCLADEMQNPDFEMSLDRYFQNPTVSVMVSSDNKVWSSNINTTKAAGYYLKTNPSYTGYLEARDTSGRVFKWLWAQDGLVYLGSSILNPLGAGVYTAQFRVWVPNETVVGETRVGDAAIAWSNFITVNLK